MDEALSDSLLAQFPPTVGASSGATDEQDHAESLFPAPSGSEPGSGAGSQQSPWQGGGGGGGGPTPGPGTGHVRGDGGSELSELQREARYPAFCRAVEGVDHLSLPSTEAVLERVQEDGHTALIPLHQIEFACEARSDEEDVYYQTLGSTSTGPLYRARWFHPAGRHEQVTVRDTRDVYQSPACMYS